MLLIPNLKCLQRSFPFAITANKFKIIFQIIIIKTMHFMPNNTAINFFFFYTSIIRLVFAKNIIISKWIIQINFRKAMTTFLFIDYMMIKYSFSVQLISPRMVTSTCMRNFLIRSIYFISKVYFHHSLFAGFATYFNSSTRESHFFNVINKYK